MKDSDQYARPYWMKAKTSICNQTEYSRGREHISFHTSI